MPELENKFQVIVSKRAAQQLVEHAVFMARLKNDWHANWQLTSGKRQILCKAFHIETQSCVLVFS